MLQYVPLQTYRSLIEPLKGPFNGNRPLFWISNTEAKLMPPMSRLKSHTAWSLFGDFLAESPWAGGLGFRVWDLGFRVQ